MKLNIGKNIKDFRKAKDITQEELSEMLGVSCQSVSRWESGTCYPDMELLPVLAEIFHISVDKLLGMDDSMEKEKVNQYLTRFQTAISKGEIENCISVARAGVAEFPNNFTLLNKLMYALFISGDSDGNIPEWKENMEKYDAEIVALGERIMAHCTDTDIRFEAVARLAFQHCEMGRKSMGRAIYETLPSQSVCRENQIWWGLEEEEKLSFLRDKIKQNYESLRSCIWLLATAKKIPDQEAVTAIEKVFALENLICDGNLPKNTWGNAKLHYDIAKLYARLTDTANMYKHLRISAESAKAFDNRPDTQRFSSVLLGEIVQSREDFETTDTRPLCEIMRDKWLVNSVFDGFRSSESFKDIVRFLSNP